jgi:hypothetical protein
MAEPTPLRRIEIDAALSQLRAILDSGATSVTVAGRIVTYDLAAIRRRIGELEHEQAGGGSSPQTIVPAKFS